MNFIGIDVSKQKLDCVVLRSNQSDKKWHKTVTNTPEGIQMLLALARKNCLCKATHLHIILDLP